ncbi:MAG: hypothetical protein QGI09_06330 [Dehalococcoidia bacterium]|nr:hypothetical protein [Dehalococcoidia bacterium]
MGYRSLDHLLRVAVACCGVEKVDPAVQGFVEDTYCQLDVGRGFVVAFYLGQSQSKTLTFSPVLPNSLISIL